MLIKFDFSSKTGILVVKFAFATANLKIETLRMRRRFARVLWLFWSVNQNKKITSIAILTVTSPIVINVPTRDLLLIETKGSFTVSKVE